MIHVIFVLLVGMNSLGHLWKSHERQPTGHLKLHVFTVVDLQEQHLGLQCPGCPGTMQRMAEVSNHTCRDAQRSLADLLKLLVRFACIEIEACRVKES